MAIRVPVIPPDVDPRPLIHHGRRGHNHRGWIHHGGRRGDDDGSRIDRHAYANGDPDSRVGGRRQGQTRAEKEHRHPSRGAMTGNVQWKMCNGQ